MKAGPSSAVSQSSRQRITAAEKQRQVLELRKAGADFTQIADRLGYRSKSGAYNAFKRALDGLVKEPAQEVLSMELSRLDAMFLGLWPQARQGHLGAVQQCLRIMERRAKYLGLDQTGAMDTTQASELLRQFAASLGADDTDDDAAA